MPHCGCNFSWVVQEPPVSITFRHQGSIPLKCIYSNPEIESYRLIYKWVQSERVGGGWSLEGVCLRGSGGSIYATLWLQCSFFYG
jgi:hypothetical protein